MGAGRSVVVVGCGFMEDGQSKRGGGWLWVCGRGVVGLGLWRWGCGGVKCGVVGLWRMADQSVAVFGCGFVGVGLWVWDCGGGVISLWRW